MQNESNLMTKYPKLVTGLFLTLVGLVFVVNTCFVYVRPNEFGVKKVNIGVNKGVVNRAYNPGYNFVLPFGIQEMFRLPRDVQVLEMTNDRVAVRKGNRRKVFTKAVRIQTSDGFFVDVDVTILYRIVDPYKVITTIGPGSLFIRNGILPKAEPLLKDTLGELTTEEFYNSPLRVASTEKAKEMLDKELEPKGMAVDHILVRYFRYSKEIQRNIEEKKLKDQLVFKNQAEAKAATEGAKLKQIVEEGQAIFDIELQKGRSYVTVREAEKDLYVRKRRSEADLLIKLAEAQKTERINEALSSMGSDKRVGLEMAKVLEGLEFVMLPSTGQDGFNPLDLDEMTQMFGIKEGASS